jgi:2-oxoisovalerate dehydrogenase E2 component (dihydrolipoyl transacylase)
MGQFVVKLPDIGEGIAESEIAQWRVAVGDTVTEDQPLVDMLTDKAAVELPSPCAGKVVELRGNAGDKIAVGSILVVLEVAGEGGESKSAGPAPAAAPATSSSKSVTSVAARPSATFEEKSPEKPEDKPLASPAVRRRARDLGVQLGEVSGSGRGGRVTHEDLQSFVSGGAPKSSPAGVRREGTEQIRIIGLRRKIAEAMQRSKQRIPHFAYVEELDVTELEALRQHLNEDLKTGQTKLSVLPFLMRALIKAVPEFPQVNATFDDEAGVVTRYHGLHIGIATQTPNGLIVPVVRHAEALDLWQSASEVKRLAEAARAGKATREELSGSSITITSLGALGGIVSTPVINAPEVAIIGVNKIVERPVVLGGAITVRKMMNLSSSFDHRIVDGYDAASFIQRIKSLLEHPATLFMDR